MATNDISIQQIRRDRTLVVASGTPKQLNEYLLNNKTDLTCCIRPNDKLLCTLEELYDIVTKKLDSLPYTKVIYTDNILDLDDAKIRQFLPSVWYDPKMVINTPIIVNNRFPFKFNEELKYMYLWYFMKQVSQRDIVAHIPSALFEVKAISNKEQEEDFKCLKQKMSLL